MKKTIILSIAAALSLSVAVANEEEQQQTPAPVQKAEAFGDWTVNCIYEPQMNKKGKPNGKAILQDCQIAQVFSINTGSEEEPNLQEIMRMYMLHERNNEGVSNDISLLFHTPLRAFLQPQVAMQVDENDAIIVPYNFCDNGGCYAGGKIDETVTNQFAKGNNVKIVFFNDARQPIPLDLSLKGYSKATQYLKEQKDNYGKELKLPK